MTCIVGLFLNGRVYVGADSAGFAGDTIFHHNNGKVFKLGTDYICAVAGLRKIADLLRYKFKPPAFETSADPDEFVNASFIPKLQEFLRLEKAVTEDYDSGELMAGCSRFVLGVRGRGVFLVSADFSADRPAPESQGGSVVAVGAGADYALAAMLAQPTMTPVERINLALGIASRLNVYVRDPFTVETF